MARCLTPHLHNTQAASAAFSFSATQGHTMQFTTHNDTNVDTNGTCLQGEVNATYEELTNLFGAPHGGDGYKVDAEWEIKFDDGRVATVYNWKDGRNYCGEQGTPVEQIAEWHVGGDNPMVVQRVQILLDLHREGKSEARKKDPLETAFESAFDMMDSIRATHGEDYAKVVEIALLVRKNQELIGTLAMTAVQTEAIPAMAGAIVEKINAEISSKIIGTAAKIANLEINGKTAEELMGWADRILEAESKGAESLLKDHIAKRKASK